jgi:hypothetical protein
MVWTDTYFPVRVSTTFTVMSTAVSGNVRTSAAVERTLAPFTVSGVRGRCPFEDVESTVVTSENRIWEFGVSYSNENNRTGESSWPMMGCASCGVPIRRSEELPSERPFTFKVAELWPTPAIAVVTVITPR